MARGRDDALPPIKTFIRTFKGVDVLFSCIKHPDCKGRLSVKHSGLSQ